ncbi:MAG: TonB-dependent receptor [Magnetospirillum sp.]|nr:TonB-dependent receptor [Magnetospirillum sp.]
MRLLPAAVAASLVPFAPQAAEPQVLQEVTVTGTREGELRSETPASVTVLRASTIESVQPAHPAELLNRVPGVTVMQTNGEGHTTGIRQPIGTGAVYLFLEDGLPTRASGFFNHNALYEVNLPQAEAVEVTRGPGSALQGSDAIGGVINVLTRPPSAKPEAKVTVEGGSYGWARALGTASGSWGDGGARGDLNLTHSDGWRNATGYDRHAATLRADHALSGGSTLKALLSASNIDQQTGANSHLSRSDYENAPTTNYTPIAFRRVKAFRASLAWDREDDDSLLSLTPYVRWNEMTLLPSWQLSYDPVIYVSGHSSLGLQAKARQDFAPWRTRLVTGLDLDYSPGFREEDRVSTTKSGSIYTAWGRGARIYDYDVTFMQASPYVHAETSPLRDLRVTGGLRLDVMRYDYDNKLGTVQTGSARRPESDTRDYLHLSPSLGATYAITPAFNAFAAYKHSFRVPSESQLFRQGSNGDSVHLLPVKVDTYEIGLRGPDKGDLSWETSVYHMIKRNDILTVRDGASPTSTNNGRTHHTGIEAALGWRFLPEWRVTAAGSYAEHTYEKWLARNGSVNVDYAGKEIPTAPSLTGSLSLAWQPAALDGLSVEGEWSHMGQYQLDDANTAGYKGHDLFNLRTAWAFGDGLEVFGRVMNVLDSRWATSGQLSSGQEQYAPGLPRTYFAGASVRF